MPDKPEKTVKQLENYYKNEPEATNNAIMAFLRDSHPEAIVYGARAINAHLPDWLEKETKDWDILALNNAKKFANELEKKLDKRYGGDFFVVEPALHPGTFKIKSRVTSQGVADITLKDKGVEFVKRHGINYTTLKYQENKAEEILDDPDKEFRHWKDKDTLQRIAVHRATKKRKARRYRQDNIFSGMRY